MSNAHSEIIKAMKGWNKDLKSFTEPPQGMFGRKAIIKTYLVTINSEELDFEFEIPFDDDVEANEAEIIIYNLSESTTKALHHNDNIVIEAGYGTDTGIIFSGYISDIKTKRNGVNKVTTIKALDYMDLKERDIVEKTYAAGTKASYILKDLIAQCSLPNPVFKTRMDWTYKKEEKVSGGLMENIRKYAEVCGISVYINKGKIYARYLYDGDNINFTVSAKTGLIESPEEFEEEVNTDSYKDIVKGYKFKMILQHQMNTAAIVTLKSINASGQFRVRSGKHIFNESESITEVEVI